MKYYFTLAPAIEKIQSNEIVLAQDIKKSSSIVKKFLRCTIDEIKKLMLDIDKGDVEDWLKEKHFYEVLLKNRPTRIFVDIETNNGEVEAVKHSIDILIKAFNIFCKLSTCDFHILDSSSDEKISFHIVGGDNSPYFKNSFHVGALIRRITCFIYSCRRNETYSSEFTKHDIDSFFDNDDNYIIDDVIYTTNRFWRMCDSSKMSFSTPRILNAPGCNWYNCMVQTTHAVACANSIPCREIDNSEPLSTSKKTMKMYQCINDTWVNIDKDSNYTNTKHLCWYPDAFNDVLNYLNNNMECLINRTSGKMDIFKGSWIFSSRSHKCEIAHRVHRSNHIYFILNPWKHTIVQKCFDDDCSNKEVEICIPKKYWNKWCKITNEKLDISECIQYCETYEKKRTI
jgi:hypothetical protein